MNRSKFLVKISVLVFHLVPLLSYGQQNFNSKKLDSLLNKLSDNRRFMGSVCIQKNGKSLFNKAYGYSVVGGRVYTSTKATTETKYRIGSISKMFTTTMIFQLIEEKKLSLETKLSQFFPEIPNASTITISNLLNHRSGIHNITNDSTYGDWHTKPQTQVEMIDRMKSAQPEFAPNEKAEYSNSNFILLGYIVEHVTGSNYQKNLQNRITNRIHLRNTYYGGKTDTSKNQSYSYHLDEDNDDEDWKQERETDMSIPGGAGAIVSTPADLCTFITSLFQGKLISQSSLDSMAVITQGYGRGIFTVPFGDRTGFGHNGGIDKFVSMVSYFPSDSLAVAVCTNALNYSLNDIVIGILSIFYHKSYEIPSLEKVRVDPALLKSYEGIYSSPDFPIKLTVKAQGRTLTAQGTGQSPFPLEAKSETEFIFTAAKISVKFNKDKNGMILKQGGKEFLMSKE